MKPSVLRKRKNQRPIRNAPPPATSKRLLCCIPRQEPPRIEEYCFTLVEKTGTSQAIAERSAPRGSRLSDIWYSSSSSLRGKSRNRSIMRGTSCRLYGCCWYCCSSWMTLAISSCFVKLMRSPTESGRI